MRSSKTKIARIRV